MHSLRGKQLRTAEASYIECGMAPAQDVSHSASAATAIPTVCIVTLDEEFLEILRTELLPWVGVVVRDSYEDLARWTREKQVSAVLLDIDTQGDDPFGGLPFLTEFRGSTRDFTLISISRARARSVEKQALSAGADAHFRSPVDVAELRMTLLDAIRRRSEDAERETVAPAGTGNQPVSGLHWRKRAYAAGLRRYSADCRKQYQCSHPRRKRHRQRTRRSRNRRLEPSSK